MLCNLWCKDRGFIEKWITCITGNVRVGRAAQRRATKEGGPSRPLTGGRWKREEVQCARINLRTVDHGRVRRDGVYLSQHVQYSRTDYSVVSPSRVWLVGTGPTLRASS